jgi:transporter family-2 protein
MKVSWIYPFIIFGGALQPCGVAMNAQLFQSLGNKWLANAVSFTLITEFFLIMFAMFPNPLPTQAGITGKPWRTA